MNDVPRIAKAAEEKFAPDVIRIRYQTGFDWSGDPAIFFRVPLSGVASRHENLGTIAERVRRELRSNIRSQSEQDQLKDPQWE